MSSLRAHPFMTQAEGIARAEGVSMTEAMRRVAANAQALHKSYVHYCRSREWEAK